jgi:hypothetical protein
MNTRHQDDGTSIHDFTDRFMVRCPKCDSCAEVIRIETDVKVHPWRARFCCSQCASTRDGTLGSWSDREPVDWVFGYNLWLQTPCCGQTLWAYNYSHLRFLASYVGADHRIGLTEEDAIEKGIRNSTLASSLPAWMIAAKNRVNVLKAIDKLMTAEAK